MMEEAEATVDHLSDDSQDEEVNTAAVSKVKVTAKKEKRGVIYLSSIPEGKSTAHVGCKFVCLHPQCHRPGHEMK